MSKMMISEAQKRAHLFLFGCIGFRFLLVYLAYKYARDHQVDKIRLLGTITLLIGISFWVLYLAKWRQNAPEAGGETWWKNIRPIHGTFWLVAGYMMLQPSLQTQAYIPLLLDTLFGLEMWLHQRVC